MKEDLQEPQAPLACLAGLVSEELWEDPVLKEKLENVEKGCVGSSVDYWVVFGWYFMETGQNLSFSRVIFGFGWFLKDIRVISRRVSFFERK